MASSNSTSHNTGIADGIIMKKVCLAFPPKISSKGLATYMLSNQNKEPVMDFGVPRLYFQMVVAFIVTQIIHSRLLKYLGMPILISQFLAGIILSNVILKGHKELVGASEEDSIKILSTVATMGYAFFMFLSGVKMDVSMAYKGGTGKKAIPIGLITLLVPMACCLLTDAMLSIDHRLATKDFFLSLTYSETSFPVMHCLLSELKILNSELGRIGLSAALVSDMMSLLLMFICGCITLFQRGTALDMAPPFIFVCIVLLVFRPAMKWVVKHTPEGGMVKDIYVYAVILVFLVTPTITKSSRLFILSAVFILGLAVPDGPPLGSALVKQFDPIISTTFLPLFATTCGMRIDLSHLLHINHYAKQQAVVSIVTLVVKFGLSLGLPFAFKMPTRDSFALAFIMLSKGIVELATYSFIYDNGIISGDLILVLSVITVLVASIVPLLVKRIYDPSRKYLGYENRTILHSKLNDELRMIGCIHVPGNVNSIIKFLHASCPTRESPIALDVLHLVKLTGRATPLFIAHQKHRKALLKAKSYSENVVLAFNEFEQANWEAVSVNVFTAVTPPNLMYEDICNLSLDKHTSFIILPFHRRTYMDGSIESEDQCIRSLNCNLLDRAPCSLGILVEGRCSPKSSNTRQTLPYESSSYSIAVIFLGGKDDREALALAIRISQDSSVGLTVIHLKATTDHPLAARESNSDEVLFDNAMLRSVKEDRYIRFMEKEVNDGPETSSFLRSIVDHYQFFIVGRRYNIAGPQTLGLEEWSEFQELGIIGDLLTSADFAANYSLLIVQQQLRIG